MKTLKQDAKVVYTDGRIRTQVYNDMEICPQGLQIAFPFTIHQETPRFRFRVDIEVVSQRLQRIEEALLTQHLTIPGGKQHLPAIHFT